MSMLAEGSIILLETFTVSIAAFIAYILYLGAKVKTSASKGTSASIGVALLKALGFVALIIMTLVFSHYFSRKGEVGIATLILFVGSVVLFFYHFSISRPIFNDERILYALMILATMTQCIFLFLLMLWWIDGRIKLVEKFEFDPDAVAQMLNNTAQLITIIIGAAMIVVTNLFTAQQSAKATRQQIYQTLELQSIELFRFEADHPELVEQFWFPEYVKPTTARNDVQSPVVSARVRDYQVRQYVCQMLNLFEMAFRFRTEQIVPADVFGSWVIWMWELCCEEKFRELWPGPKGLELNYVGDFRKTLSRGLELAAEAKELNDTGDEKAALEKRDKFAEFIADQIGGCEELRKWFDEPTCVKKLC